MNRDQLTAEACFAIDLTRLKRLVAAHVLTETQASQIAVRVARKTGAHLGSLHAGVLVDLSVVSSDV